MRLPMICDSCRHLDPDPVLDDEGMEVSDQIGTCPAFPDGIDIPVAELHDQPLPDQVGDTVYELDPDRQGIRDLYFRVRGVA